MLRCRRLLRKGRKIVTVLRCRHLISETDGYRASVCKEVGFPTTIRVHQGSKFVSRDLDLWA